MRIRHVLVLGAAFTMVAGLALAQPGVSAAPTAAPASPAPSFAKAGRPYGRFARMDLNGDGKVTRAEFIAFQDQTFDRIDVNHTGQITKADLDAFMARREAVAAGRMMRAKGGGQGGGGGEEKMLTKLSDRLSTGGAVTRSQWEVAAGRRFDRLDAGRLGYLTPETMHPPGAMGPDAPE